MTNPRVCVLFADGTNCDAETAHAFALAGGDPETVHINQLRSGLRRLADYQILAIPGGFSYGDDVASGVILANELVTFLRDQLQTFVDAGKLVLGICNGFQVLVRTGLLPFGMLGKQAVTLADNNCGHFDCRWIKLHIESHGCVFTAGLDGSTIELMTAHGEGKFFNPDPAVILPLESAGQVVLRYTDGQRWTTAYPANPNGSVHAIAGVCDQTGRIFGLMPHPERFVRREQHPNWRRPPSNVAPHGLPIFQNAVSYARDL